MHRLLAQQIERTKTGSNSVDSQKLLALISEAYEEADRDRRRTDRSISLMVEELDALNTNLEKEVAARTRELDEVRRLLEATLAHVDQGIVMLDAQGQVRIANPRAAELIDLDDGQRPSDADLVTLLSGISDDRGDVSDDNVFEVQRASGRILEIRRVPLAAGGAVITLLDVTERRERELALRSAEAEYRSLFENSVVGIYRSSIDGRQLRANPSLVRLNGYRTEGEQLAAVNDIATEWYVDPKRRDEFVRLMMEHGRVTDFVSEVYRHGTRERIWVSETAWIVRGPDGQPLCFEGTVIDATERMRAEAEIAHLAHHDVLTDLPNRSMLLKRMREAMDFARPGRSIAVLCLDLDRFKEVNDTLGHPAGDELLRIAADRLSKSVRTNDLVARLGGDEFAVLQVDVRSVDDVAALATRLVDIVSEPYQIAGNHVVVGTSIGVAIAPEHGHGPDELLRNADIALYRAKGDGRRTFAVFEPKMNEVLQARRQTEVDLRGALGNNEFELFFQPIIDTEAGRIACHEALIRWRHSSRGLVSPAEFIPVAEETGLMVPIGEFVIARAAAVVAEGRLKSPVAINLSPVQFRDRQLVNRFEMAIATAGISPNDLEVEITESVLLMDDRRTWASLNELKAMGLRIALDDFGTGQSSLSYLQKFTFDKIKIDRSFAAQAHLNPVNAAVVRAVLSLGRDLGIRVVAEGVETEEELAWLRREGCRWFQGYLFGKPQPLGGPAVEPRLTDILERMRGTSLLSDPVGLERRRA